MNNAPFSGEASAAAPAAAGGQLTVYHSSLAHAHPAAAPAGVADPAWFSGGREAVISLVDIIGYLRARWKMGVLIGFPLAVLAFAFLGLGAKVFEAESRLLLRIQDANVFNFNEMGKAGLTELSAPMLVNNHRAEMKSRRFVDYFYDHLTEPDRAAFIDPALKKKPAFAGIKQMLGLSPPPVAPDRKAVFATKLDLSTRVDVLKDSHVLRIQVRDNDPALAAKFANLFAESYIRYAAEEELGFSRSTSVFLEDKSKELFARLQESERRLAEYKESHGLLQDNPANDSDGEKVKLLTAALADANVKLARARRDSETIAAAKQSGQEMLDVRVIAGNADLVATRRALDTAISTRAPLVPLLGPKHPKMVALNAQIEKLQADLQRDIESVVTMVSAEEQNLGRQVADLQQQLDAARKTALAKGGTDIQHNLLRDQVALDRELYQKIMTRRSQADLTGDFKDTGALRVSDVAVPPTSALKPNKALALLAAMALFGITLVGVPVGSGLWYDHIAPSLRVAPVANAPEPALAQARAQAEEGTSLLPPVPAMVSASAKNRFQPAIIASLPNLYAGSPPLMLAELLRKAPGGATSMLHGLTATLERDSSPRGGPRIVLLTSATPGEGKSMVSSALAAAFCARGRKVFLIECNPTSPSLSQWFPQCSTGARYDASMEVLRYGGSNLFLLPATDLPSYEVSDLLDSYRGWIERALPVVDWIILDGASLMRDFADVAPLVPMASDVVFVSDATRSTDGQVKAAFSLLKPMMVNDVLRGVVLNRERA